MNWQAGLARNGESEEQVIRNVMRGRQFGASTKKVRGLSSGTWELRHAIIDAFEGTSKPVTVRQMYYLLTTMNAVEKTEAGYRRVQRQLLIMRREELIPYEWIADNTRWMRKPTSYGGLRECLEESARFYRASIWRDLPDHVQIWCEKDALAGVLFQETHRYDVPLMVTRGYSSETFAYESAQEMLHSGKDCFVYYVGDLDPSGWQAAKDLERKFEEFTDHQVEFERLAVTTEQAIHWRLPSRPSKRSDTRHKAFEREFGAGAPSIELDAVPPDRLRQLVREAIETHIPRGHLDAIALEEREARSTLETMVEAMQWL